MSLSVSKLKVKPKERQCSLTAGGMGLILGHRTTKAAGHSQNIKKKERKLGNGTIARELKSRNDFLKIRYKNMCL